MKKIRWILGFALLAASTDCAHAPPVLNNVLSAVVDCTVPKIHDLAISLIPTVETIVAKRGEGWEDDLAALGKQSLEDALACAVREVEQTAFAAAASAPSDALSAAKAQRAQQYAKTRGYRFADGP
jgi:hypothetical protein